MNETKRTSVYIGQKEGGTYDGGVVWKFSVKENVPSGTIAAGGWSALLLPGFDAWPNCKSSGQFSTTSWSSPTANPFDLSVFVGANRNNKGVYRLLQTADAACPVEGQETAWFNHHPQDGWRTAPIFTDGDGQLIHIGSSHDLFYTLNSVGTGTSYEWCYDLEVGAKNGAIGAKCDD